MKPVTIVYDAKTGENLRRRECEDLTEACKIELLYRDMFPDRQRYKVYSEWGECQKTSSQPETAA